MRRRSAFAAAASVAYVLLMGSPWAIAADGECGPLVIQCIVNSSGLDTTSTIQEWENQPRFPGEDAKSAVQAAAGPRYESAATSACTMSPPGSPGADSLCTMALTTCSDPARGTGPLTRIWRRTVQEGQPLGAWVPVGITCFADVVPGARPAVTLAMIQDAFNRTPWAQPQISTQPAGNVTLVGLDTYYKVNWTPQGFQPGEIDAIDPARMNGYRADID